MCNALHLHMVSFILVVHSLLCVLKRLKRAQTVITPYSLHFIAPPSMTARKTAAKSKGAPSVPPSRSPKVKTKSKLMSSSPKAPPKPKAAIKTPPRTRAATTVSRPNGQHDLTQSAKKSQQPQQPTGQPVQAGQAVEHETLTQTHADADTADHRHEPEVEGSLLASQELNSNVNADAAEAAESLASEAEQPQVEQCTHVPEEEAEESKVNEAAESSGCDAKAADAGVLPADGDGRHGVLAPETPERSESNVNVEAELKSSGSNSGTAAVTGVEMSQLPQPHEHESPSKRQKIDATATVPSPPQKSQTQTSQAQQSSESSDFVEVTPATAATPATPFDLSVLGTEEEVRVAVDLLGQTAGTSRLGKLQRLFNWPSFVADVMKRIWNKLPASDSASTISLGRNMTLKQATDINAEATAHLECTLGGGAKHLSDDDRNRLSRLQEKIASTTMSSAYSGVDTPATALSQLLWSVCQELDLDPSDAHCGHQKNMFAVEVLEKCQYELQQHPHGPLHCFKNVLDFFQPVVRDRLDTASAEQDSYASSGNCEARQLMQALCLLSSAWTRL